jgi:hypothetical protein
MPTKRIQHVKIHPGTTAKTSRTLPPTPPILKVIGEAVAVDAEEEITAPVNVAVDADVEEEVIKHGPESTPSMEALPADPVALPREGKTSSNTPWSAANPRTNALMINAAFVDTAHTMPSTASTSRKHHNVTGCLALLCGRCQQRSVIEMRGKDAYLSLSRPTCPSPLSLAPSLKKLVI